MNYFAYRIPGKAKAYRFCSETLIQTTEIPAKNGFLFAPFFFDGNFRFIPAERKLKKIPANLDNSWSRLSLENASHNQYSAYIHRIKDFISGDPDKKIVASRRLVIERQIDPEAFFDGLCNAYPNSYVYLISTPQTGTWIGASPELLLSRKENHLQTLSLAGTQPSGTNVEWDAKNLKEQQIVTSYIISTMEKHGFSPSASNIYTRQAGPVEHLATDIIATMKSPAQYVSTLLADLYPTPALSGFPKKEALEIIRENEADGRGLYGGFSGPVEADGNFDFYVNLRCLNINGNKITLFAGGGITALSEPESEWMETERKLSTLLSMI